MSKYNVGDHVIARTASGQHLRAEIIEDLGEHPVSGLEVYEVQDQEPGDPSEGMYGEFDENHIEGRADD